MKKCGVRALFEKGRLTCWFILLIFSFSFSANISKGKKLYGKYCATCHGKKGNGAGPAGKSLKPKPANFKKGKFKYGCSLSKMGKIIKYGVKGKPMPPFGKKLKSTQVKDVSYYILKGFVPKKKAKKCLAARKKKKKKAKVKDYSKSAYAKYCATCHGKKGNGAGPAGKSLKPKPTNFKKGKFKYGCSPSKIGKIIKYGVKGKPMPPFKKKLNSTRIKQMSRYILNTFVPKKKAKECQKKK